VIQAVYAPVANAGGEVPEYRIDFTGSAVRRGCIVIPVINEGERLHRLLDRMAKIDLASLADLIVVDGGSIDGSVTPDRLKPRSVHTLITKIGPGKLSAQLRCGYAHALAAGYEDLVTIDGNDKDDPSAVPRFFDALRGGYDFVQASRFIPGGVGENTPRLREFAIRAFHAPLLSWASGFPWTDTTQGFRAYSRRLLLDPRIAPFRSDFSSYELLAYMSYRAPRLGYKCVELPTVRRYPATGAIPTKVGGLAGNLQLLGTLVRVCVGGLNPRQVARDG